MQSPKIVGLGHANVDYLGVVPRFPELDQKVELGQFSMQGGGPAATAMVAAARQGSDSALISTIGDDSFGRFIETGLRADGVDVSRMVVQEGRISSFSFVVVDQATGKRNVFWTRGDLEPLPPDRVDLAVLEGADVLLLDGHHIEAAAAALKRARELGVTVLLDAGTVRPGMEELARACDVLVTSERFAAEVARRGEPEDSLEVLLSWGPGSVVITLGESGSIGAVAGGQPILVPAVELRAVDTTGAGDVYHGAFAHSLALGKDLAYCMAFSTAAAGLKCRALGGRDGIPGPEETATVAAALLELAQGRVRGRQEG